MEPTQLCVESSCKHFLLLLFSSLSLSNGRTRPQLGGRFAFLVNLGSLPFYETFSFLLLLPTKKITKTSRSTVELFKPVPTFRWSSHLKIGADDTTKSSSADRKNHRTEIIFFRHFSHRRVLINKRNIDTPRRVLLN